MRRVNAGGCLKGISPKPVDRICRSGVQSDRAHHDRAMDKRKNRARRELWKGQTGTVIRRRKVHTPRWRQCAQDPAVNYALRLVWVAFAYAFQLGVVISIVACSQHLDFPIFSVISRRYHD